MDSEFCFFELATQYNGHYSRFTIIAPTRMNARRPKCLKYYTTFNQGGKDGNEVIISS
jgi:hypothetical protein